MNNKSKMKMQNYTTKLVRGLMLWSGICLVTMSALAAMRVDLGLNEADLTVGEQKYLALTGRDKSPALVEASRDAALPREEALFDFDWQFCKGDLAGAEQPGFDDSKWSSVTLPHDGLIDEPFDENAARGKGNGYRPHGITWYRKAFMTPATMAGRKALIEFEGVMQEADVWLNGIHLGRNIQSYLGFEFDLTPYLKPPGQTNLLAVRADDTYADNGRWYNGNGLYRDVTLRYVNALHIPLDGVYVTTPEITPDAASVRVRVEVANHSTTNRLALLSGTVRDPSGQSLLSQTRQVRVAAGETEVVELLLSVREPKLWSPDAPTLYSVETAITDMHGVQDRITTPFGIRTIQLVAGRGLLVNGKKVVINGGCIHHTFGCLGAAAYHAAIDRHVRLLKEAGCNGVRLAHNPYSRYMLAACDRAGLLVWDEMYDKWNSSYSNNKLPFEDTYRIDLGNWVRRDRNHPSVMCWSVGNEVDWNFWPSKEFKNIKLEVPGGDVMTQGQRAEVRDGESRIPVLHGLTTRVRELDPSRPTACAFAFTPELVAFANPKTGRYETGRKDLPHAMYHEVDFAGSNYKQKLFKKWHEEYPELPLCATETGTWGGAKSWFEFDHDYTVGQFYWGIIDYLGENKDWPNKNWPHGQIDRCGFFKPNAYAVKASVATEPLIRCAIYRPGDEGKGEPWCMESQWNWPGQQEVSAVVWCNTDEVELILNGKSLGRQKVTPERKVDGWKIPYAAGELKAVALQAGQPVAEHVLRTAGAAAKIELKPDRAQLKADGQDLSFVEVVVTDEHGVRVPDAGNLIRFAVTGPGENMGVDNADYQSNELWHVNERRAFKGSALLVVRSQRQGGTIRVTATAEGLTSATIELTAK